MTKLSVIVPVYNAATYLTRCMDSLRTQTLQELEVLLVDDHGQDDSVAIAQDYINHFVLANWHILHTPQNGGPGAARNVGLAAATGELIAFCDADDYVEPTMYESLYQLAHAEQADVVCADAYLHDGEKTSILQNPKTTDTTAFLRHYVAYLWTFAFRREWLETNGIRFEPVRSAEDSVFIAEAVLVARRLAYTPEVLYHYIVYPNSISHRRRVWRGGEKRKAFRALLRFARQRRLSADCRSTLGLIYVKKALLTPIIEYLR